MALDDSLADALKISATDLIRPTHWPNIDLVGAQLNLYWAEFQIPVWRSLARVEAVGRAERDAGGRRDPRPL